VPTTIEHIKNKIMKLGYLLCSPREVSYYMNRVLWEFGHPSTKLSPTPLENIFLGIDSSTEEVTVQYPFSRLRGTSVELDELMVILAIVKHVRAKEIIEIGTFDGNTTLRSCLVKNSLRIL
jgi:hypothetical protein